MSECYEAGCRSVNLSFVSVICFNVETLGKTESRSNYVKFVGLCMCTCTTQITRHMELCKREERSCSFQDIHIDWCSTMPWRLQKLYAGVPFEPLLAATYYGVLLGRKKDYFLRASDTCKV